MGAASSLSMDTRRKSAALILLLHAKEEKSFVFLK
jgi:hypothetical protein